MFGAMAVHFGYAPDQIRAMTLPDVARLSRYLARNVPLRDLVAAIAKSLGISVPEPTRSDPSHHMTMDAWKALVDATGGRIDGVARG